MATLSVNVSGQKIVPILLVASLTALTLTDALDGQVVDLEFQQNSTGGFTVASTQLNGLNQPNPAANAITHQSFRYTALNNSWAAVPTPNGVQATISSNGAATIADGITLIGGSGATAVTLAQPVAGEQDGITMKFCAISAQAHTITTSADGINGVGDTITFGGAIGDCVVLQAEGGVWYEVGGVGVVLTEA